MNITLLACLQVNRTLLPFIPLNYVFEIGCIIVKHVKYVSDIGIYMSLPSSDPKQHSINILYSVFWEKTCLYNIGEV